MISQEGLNYVKQQLDLGVSPQVLRQAMVAVGWQAADVDVLINTVITQKTEAVSPSVAADVIAETKAVEATPAKVHKNSRGVVVAAILFLFFGGLAAAYFFVYSPQKVFAVMPTKIQKIRTSNFNFSLKSNLSILNSFSISDTSSGTGSGNAESSAGTTISLTGTGQSDLTNPTSPKSATKLSGSFSINGAPSQVADLELRIVENNLYLKVDKLPEFGIGTAGFLGQWIKADAATISQSGGEQIQKEVAPEQIAKIQAVYARNVFVVIKKSPKFEKLNSDFVYHYEFSIDKEKLKLFISDYNKSVLLKPANDVEMNVISGTISNFPDFTGHMWIGVFDSYLRKVTFSSIVTDSALIPFSGNMEFSLILEKINKPVSVEVPTESKSMTDVINGVTSNLSPSTDTDGDGMTDKEELVWNTDKTKVDSDGDTYTDLNEICNGFNPNGPDKLTIEQSSLSKPDGCTRVQS